ncbi:ribonuclease H-like domain-containing protein [Aspergillus crustosus]
MSTTTKILYETPLALRLKATTGTTSTSSSYATKETTRPAKSRLPIRIKKASITIGKEGAQHTKPAPAKPKEAETTPEEARAVSASKGHPEALSAGNWTMLQQNEQDVVFAKLQAHIHEDEYQGKMPYATTNEPATPLPTPDPTTPKRRIVALDCEMVVPGWDEPDHLAQVCAVDVLTGDILLDILVQPPSEDPDSEIFDYRTQYSGLSKQLYHHYTQHGLVVQGIEGAQRTLFNFVDSNTILAGHALHNDLRALGIKHDRILDTQVLARKAVQAAGEPGYTRRWGLVKLVEEMLGREIRMENNGQHDCLEDVLAPREVLLWMARDEEGVVGCAEREVQVVRETALARPFI